MNRFEASFNCGPMTWLRHYRMTLAAARLRSGHETVAKVAESLGYENSNNFSTAFKAFHGLSPLRYPKWSWAEKSLPDAKVETGTNWYTATKSRNGLALKLVRMPAPHGSYSNAQISQGGKHVERVYNGYSRA
ncbi:helix-turn-helix domain-containing protein [Sinorhizobium meliloti]|uniref:helix-turn-helix domain-containing protein n=1 Tax=Rhizobium meliloti TaxID=382 RepID=UPI0018F341E9|nr:helix-turn-helix transcriptional regulator [Sinorhizobium meliloti]